MMQQGSGAGGSGSKPDGRASKSRELVWVALLLGTIAVFYGLTMRPGQLGNDDSAQYIQHAKNLSEGEAYDTIPWVYHEDGWNPGPRAYPPVFPLFLAPLYREFGLELQPMHFLTLVFFIVALAIIYVTFRNELGILSALALVAIISFNPCFWDFRDSISSDIPFFCLCYLTLLMVEKSVAREESGVPFLAYSMLTGVVLYAACGTRVVGISIIPAILSWSLVRRRKILKSLGIIAAVGIILEVAETAMLRTFQSYGKNFARQTHATLSASWIIGHGRSLAHYWLGSMATLWSNGRSRDLELAFFAFTLIIAAVGLGVHLSWNIRVHDLFGLFYLPALFCWMEMRYLIPLIPLYLFYAIVGLMWLTRRMTRQGAMALCSGLGLLVALTYASAYLKPEPEGTFFDTTSPQEQQMFAFIRTQTTSSDVIESLMPRVLSLYTGRKSSEYDYAPDSSQGDVDQYFCRTGITYIVSTSQGMSQSFSDFVQSNRGSWSLVFSNQMFQVYRVPSSGCGATTR